MVDRVSTSPSSCVSGTESIHMIHSPQFLSMFHEGPLISFSEFGIVIN